MGYIFDALKKSVDPGARGTDPASSTGDNPAPSYRLSHAAGAAPASQQGRPRPGQTAAPRAAQPSVVQHTDSTVAKPPHGPLRAAAGRPDDRLVAITHPSKAIAEGYRTLRGGLLARWGQRRHLVHAITSAERGEGKTLTCLNLALSMAEFTDRRTLVVEADLRHPRFTGLMSIEPGVGLLGVLEGNAPARDAIVCLEGSGLFVLPAGPGPCDHSLQVLSGPKLQATLAQLRQQFDHVFVDTPAVGQFADAAVIGAVCDEVLLVTKVNETPMAVIEQAVRNLAQHSVNLAGAIVTGQRCSRRPSSWGVAVPQQLHGSVVKTKAA